jgi:hypothetical protein
VSVSYNHSRGGCRDRKSKEKVSGGFTSVDSLYDAFMEIFLTGSNLEHFLIHSCNASATDNTDPITNTIVAMMGSPICISLSNVGVRGFKNTSIATLPYVLLQEDQVNFVTKLLASVRHGIVASSNSDANGGFVLRLPPPSKNKFVDKILIMEHLQIAIGKSSGYGTKETKQNVYDIIAQRVHAMITLPNIPNKI